MENVDRPGIFMTLSKISSLRPKRTVLKELGDGYLFVIAWVKWFSEESFHNSYLCFGECHPLNRDDEKSESIHPVLKQAHAKPSNGSVATFNYYYFRHLTNPISCDPYAFSSIYNKFAALFVRRLPLLMNNVKICPIPKSQTKLLAAAAP
ncbi:hypothetical protein BCON_0015g00420 [Botryotinia convoluta]|uniref:Uncharacterized protein n=1 Tax=Botryotinia convoluta TaxID=54673 RepID=A0A4Z1J1R6_9HELO|nr:hypothetical protein BCON_0015g00420 [Botryotinia convoluta]